MDANEPQYNKIEEIIEKYGAASLGIMANWSWNEGPKKLLFGMSRYKFVPKMLSGKNNVLEIGCAEAFSPLKKDGMALIGITSLESQAHASP